MNYNALTGKELTMSITDNTLSLQTTLATLRDAAQILDFSLEQDELFLRKQKWPDFIKSLSSLGKSVERSLITGRHLVFPEETFLLHRGTKLPKFLFSLFSIVFTDDGLPRYILAKRDGRLILVDSDGRSDSGYVAERNSHCVLLLRQILLLFSKSEDLEPDVEPDEEILRFQDRVTREVRIGPNSMVYSMARCVLDLLFMDEGRIHPSLAQWEAIPFGLHGPGAVASGEVGGEKWNFVVDCLRLPSELYSDNTGRVIGTHNQACDFTSRMCLVPKDFRGRRVICIEPKELQFAQQGLLRVFEQIIHNSIITNRHISLNNQEKSFYMSRDMSFGTIDLKDASDNISLRLARLLLPKPVFEIVTRYRCNFVKTKNGTFKSTAFLTMGNALCFPLETLIFWSLAVANELTVGGTQIPSRFLIMSPEDKKLYVSRLRLRVFGDDIIVPVHSVEQLCNVLTSAGLVINHDKTCTKTLVRESCGSWWYANRDCRITKLKYCQTKDLNMWVSLFDVIPILRENGFLQTASVLEASCDEVYPTPNHNFGADKERRSQYLRFNADLWRMEYRRPLRDPGPTRALPGRIGVYAWFVQSATRFLYTKTQGLKYRWVALT